MVVSHQLPPSHCSVGIWPPASSCMCCSIPWACPSSPLSPLSLPVSASEACFLLIEKTFEVPCDPWLVVGEVVLSLGWYGGVFTESNVILWCIPSRCGCPMWSPCIIPVRQPKAILRSFLSLCPAPQSPWVVTGCLCTTGTHVGGNKKEEPSVVVSLLWIRFNFHV